MVVASAQTRVETAAGVLEGLPGGVFLGIPFAAPPIGDLGWKPPQPVSPWAGMRKATEFGPACPQSDFAYTQTVFDEIAPSFPYYKNPRMSEDCLTLNVWTTGSQKKSPVMVWIHGGGNIGG